MVVSLSDVAAALSHSAMTAVHPSACHHFGQDSVATTGNTLATGILPGVPTYLPGLPAPVVTTETLSSAAILASSSAWGCMSMMFTPKGLSVRERHLRMCSRNYSGLMPPAPMRPSAPALETAAANAPVAILAMPP